MSQFSHYIRVWPEAKSNQVFLVSHGDDADMKPFYERASSKRPARKLSSLRKDSHVLHNVAEDTAYSTNVKHLDACPMAELKATSHARANGIGDAAGASASLVGAGNMVWKR